MSVKVKINNREFNLSWRDFKRMILNKPHSSVGEIVSFG